MPFALREFMIKCWKRHRDVPTSIDQLVDRAVEDLERRRKDLTLRMKKNKIKLEPLEKVENLLHCCFEVADNFPDECGPDMRTLKTKLKTMKQDQETGDARFQRTQMRFIALRKKGILGQGQTGSNNWEFAISEAPQLHEDMDRTVVNHQPAVEHPQALQISTEPPVQEVSEESQITDEWVECVNCSKWRVLPRGINAATLRDDWTCSSGSAWRLTGLSCDVDEDVDEDASNEDNVHVDECDCHQPLVGAYLVKRVPVALDPEEETWLRSGWGLRPCYTWNDGYSLYRCTAANRGTTKQKMLMDILHFWGYKWLHDEDDETVGPYENKEYEYLDGYGTTNVTLRAQKLNKEVSMRNIEALRLVQDTLMRGTSDRLNKRYKTPDEYLESLVVMDKMVILLIDTTAEPNVPRYSVYCPDRCLVTNRMQDVSWLLDGARDRTMKIRGIAYGNTQYCALFPHDEQPNFAGASAIGQFE